MPKTVNTTIFCYCTPNIEPWECYVQICLQNCFLGINNGKYYMKVLYCVARKKILPLELYCIKDIIYNLASLGGKKGTSSDGDLDVKFFGKEC